MKMGDITASLTPATPITTTGTTDVSSGKVPHLDKLFADDSDELKEMLSLTLSDDEEEDLEMMAKKIRDIEEKRTQTELLEAAEEPVDVVPAVYSTESTDDFIRNFMFKMGLTRTLDCFETEWYERNERGLITVQTETVVPDMHIRCMELENKVSSLEADIQRFRASADKFKEKFNRVCKERDYHRMHHRRVVQEKNKLLAKIEEIQKHYSEYEPTLKAMQQQYEKAFRDRVLLTMEKEQMNTKMINMQAVLKNKAEATRFTSVHSQEAAAGDEKEAEVKPNDSKFPLDEGFNPALAKFKNVVYKKDDFTPAFTFYAHSFAVTGLAIHSEENLFVTASDDFTWKLWPVPFGESILSGKGHCEWLTDCMIGPKDMRLATSSGDCTVKIWELLTGKCLHTFTDHQLAVWKCHWHNCGDFIASCSMDCTIRISDLNSLRCRLTLRGHKDSVNSVEFLSYSNILVSASSDKTVALWDARTGFCGQILTGHTSSVTSANFNLRGDTIASGDARGELKLWDIRTNSSINTIDIGPTAFINDLSFDPAGSLVILACNDTFVRVFELVNKQIHILGEHSSSVNVVQFHDSAHYLMTADNDGLVKVWTLRSSLAK